MLQKTQSFETCVSRGQNEEVIVDEHSIMCSIKPDRGSQVYIEKHAANVVHYGQVESLYLIERIIFRLHHD